MVVDGEKIAFAQNVDIKFRAVSEPFAIGAVDRNEEIKFFCFGKRDVTALCGTEGTEARRHTVRQQDFSGNTV